KHIYFIAETKGGTNSLQFREADLRETEKAKKKCAEEHFKAISSDNVKYGVVCSYEELLSIVK
ncbi:MAG: type III restriction endonuclease subunit R, partial [Muribaculaceae bacterium]